MTPGEIAGLITALVLLASAVSGGVAWLWSRRRAHAEYALLPVEGFAALASQLAARNEVLTGRLDRQAEKIERLEARIDAVEAERDSLRGKLREENEGCRQKIIRLEQQLEDHRIVINGWLAGYEIMREKFAELGVTPPWAPAGPLLPREE